MSTVIENAQKAKLASYSLQSAKSEDKSRALQAIRQLLIDRRDFILAENKKDLEAAKLQVEAGTMSKALFKRLDLSGSKYDALIQGVSDMDKLDDPAGKVSLARQLDDGLELYKVSCPVGVLLIIFEARPEVVVQISCLALKSGNSVILKGGKEASFSNQALFATIQEALTLSKVIPADAVQLAVTRDDISQLLKMDRYIDLVIPRGSNSLVRHVQDNTRIPVLGHADGICSVFIDSTADVTKAVRVVVDGKINYPAACNATEKVLIHTDVVDTHLVPIVDGLLAQKVLIHADQECLTRLSKTHAAEIAEQKITLAKPEDFETEFLELELAIGVTDSVASAISHINEHGSHHTDCIVTETPANANLFMALIDSAGTYWNASTRFADGFRYGFGAEIGVSTNKTHARGPVGLEGLMIYKYRMYGNGHIVGEYNEGVRSYNRKDISLDIAQAKIAQ